MRKLTTIILLSSLVALTSCADYLDRKNLDSFDDANFWTSEQNMRAFAQGAYMTYFKGYANAWAWDRYFTSAGSADDFYNTGVWGTTTATSGNGWSFTNVRRHNVMINRVDLMPVPEETKNHWRGVGRFFRAMEYANLVWVFGDMPFYDRQVFPADSKDLQFKARDPRAMVCTKIMEDYEYAAANVRPNDGIQQINRYVVLGMMSRDLLQLGTMLKYHGDDPAVAQKLIEKSKWASEQLMSSGLFQIVDDYRGIFASDDLSGNKEVIFYREYAAGKVTHSLITYSSGFSTESQQGVTLKSLNAYLTVDGLPIKQSPVYNYNSDNNTRLYVDMYKNRDPRLYATLNDTMRINGADNAYALTGICVNKFTPYVFSTPDNYTSDKNITDAPIIRYGEILLNYAEAAAELGQFDQTAANASINVLRNRNIKKDNKGDVLPKLPKMIISGSNVTANGVVINDPDRDPSVSPVLWEIRREREVELMMEGFRKTDLKRWKKYSYIANREIGGVPREGVLGSYFDFTKYNDAQKELIRNKNTKAALYCPIPGDSSRIALNPITSQLNRRDWVDGDITYERQYFTSIPKNQIKLYKDNGYKLAQNPGWEEE